MEKQEQNNSPELDTTAGSTLLGPVAIRELSRALNIQPTKKLGQNFLHDGGTVRRIVSLSGVEPGEVVIEVGPGLGSLTLGLLEAGAKVCAVEIDSNLAQALPATVRSRQPDAEGRLRVFESDALEVTGWQQCASLESVSEEEAADREWSQPVRLVANLPYNVAVPILLHFLSIFPSLESALVMVQAEVADRLSAGPGSRTYGVPSVKAAWYGNVHRSITVGRSVFWPAPNIDSALVDLQLFSAPRGSEVLRRVTFKIVDAAFAQRRKMMRAVLRSWLDSSSEAGVLLKTAGIDETRRGETLTVEEYQSLGQAALDLVSSADSVDIVPNLVAAVSQAKEEKRYA